MNLILRPAVSGLLITAAATALAAGTGKKDQDWSRELLESRSQEYQKLIKLNKREDKAEWKKFWLEFTAKHPECKPENLSKTLEDQTKSSEANNPVLLYIATNGSDDNPGTIDKPFKTVFKARDVIRAMKSKGELARPVKVLFRKGFYFLSRPLSLGTMDSGTASAPISYEAYGKEYAIISGGYQIGGKWHDNKGIWENRIPADIMGGSGVVSKVTCFDPSVIKVGEWAGSDNKLHDLNKGKGQKSLTFLLNVPEDGSYEVLANWENYPNRASRIPIDIKSADGTNRVYIDERKPGEKHSLGVFRFKKGKAEVKISNEGTDNYVAAHEFILIKPGSGKPLAPRQLFVNGKRAMSARYPNFDNSDICRKGWLYNNTSNLILAGLTQKGDWAEWKFSTDAPAKYNLWLGCASEIKDLNKYFIIKLDGKALPVDKIKTSTNWRVPVWSKLAKISVPPGEHRLRIEATGPEGQFNRMHVDGFMLSTADKFSPTSTPAMLPGEKRIVVEAENNDLFVDGRSKTMAFTKIIAGSHDKKLITFKHNDEKQVLSWNKAPQAEIYMFAQWGWFNTITNLDSVTKYSPGVFRIKMSGKEVTAVHGGNRFYIMNLLSELDVPGEWFINYKTGKIYYMPRKNEDMTKSQFIIPMTDRLIQLKASSNSKLRVEYISFKNLTFAHTDYTPEQPDTRSTKDCAILLENAWNCSVENCSFRNIGGYAVRLSMDCVLNRIDGNKISEAGAGGIILNGPYVGWGRCIYVSEPGSEILAPLGNLITRNTVENSGVIKKYVAGVHWDTRPDCMRYAIGNVISNNLIRHMPRNGIFGFRNLGGYVIEKNLVYDVLKESDDGGLIHVCTNALNDTAPALMRNNIVFDVTAFRNDDYIAKNKGMNASSNGHGLYLDGYTSNVRAENNIIANTRRGGIYTHMGANNSFYNNVVMNDKINQIWVVERWNNRFENNIVIWTTDTPYLLSVTKLKEPAPGQALFNKNLYWHGGKEMMIGPFDFNFKQWQTKFKADVNSIVADPKIMNIDLKKKIFKLSSDSPAYKIGYKDIDTSIVGPDAPR